MSMQELIQIENTPAVVDFNSEHLRAHLATKLEKYDVVVTVDTVADAKKMATELNAIKKEIDTRRKEEVAKASEPVKLFDTKMKELVTMCADGRQKILDQVSKFEEETLILVSGMLKNLRADLFKLHGVNNEFVRAKFDDLIKISSATAKGNLTKSAKDELEKRVLADKSRQDQTARRLLELENQSLRAGLTAPLTRDHVKAFLFDDDEAYQSEVDLIIAVEVSRQEEIEAAARHKMAKEQAQEQSIQQPAAETVKEAPESTQSPEIKDPAPTRIPNNGKVKRAVTCVFEVETNPAVTAAAIEAELRKVLKAAGITTLKTVTVETATSNLSAVG